MDRWIYGSSEAPLSSLIFHFFSLSIFRGSRWWADEQRHRIEESLTQSINP
jgi:hypothetical protein